MGYSFLEELQIREYFEVIKTREDVEKVKPDPALYRVAIEELGIKPSEAVVFEDSLNGLRAKSCSWINVRCGT